MNYYISDLHLFHKNVTNEGSNFDKRPFDSLKQMHDEIKKHWNERITNQDDVYILGDFCWKENEEAIQLVSSLKGRKHLIIGNHDKLKDQRYIDLFVEVTTYKEVSESIDGMQYRFILQHYPIMFWNHQHHLKDGKAVNIHFYGHVHNSVEEDLYQQFLKVICNQFNDQYIAINVGCMMPYINYMPRNAKEILAFHDCVMK